MLKKAEEKLILSLEQKPNHYLALDNMGLVLMHLGRVQAEANRREEVSQKNPRYLEIFLNSFYEPVLVVEVA
jgi:hypothetical protein